MPGRGEYYKNKYGGRRGRGRGSGSGHAFAQTPQVVNDHELATAASRISVKDWQQLANDIGGIDGSQYGAYNLLRGQYHHTAPDFTLSIDRIQGDPYAPPSRIRAIMAWTESGFPAEYLASDIRKIAVCDFLTRAAADVIRAKHLNRQLGNRNGGWSGPKGGAFNINSPGQEVLPRSSAMVDGNETIELRFTVALPAAGRRILGREALQILGDNLVQLVQQSMLHENLDQVKLRQHVLSVEQQHALRVQLLPRGLIAFVANGSILPRASGAAAMPMDGKHAVPFQSPKDAEVALRCLDGSEVYGMGVTRGITLLTGGGFHGKSTLLEALELGIYNHIPGDGREGVVTDPTAVKIRAEDGRSVTSVDFSPFIDDLPGGKDTKRFSTDDASGSTSMASNVQEALEAGCQTILIDEDSSATNLLVRDHRMQILIRKEPITPLISKARALYRDHGVSTVIVIGGLGDWLSVADNVILMESYVPRMITADAKAVLNTFPCAVVLHETYGSRPERKLRVTFKDMRTPYAPRKDFISIKPTQKDPVDDPAGAEPGIDLSGLDQLVEVGQARMIAHLLEEVARETANAALSLESLLQRLDDVVGTDHALPVGLQGGEVVAVRRFEFAAALSRLRGLHVGN